MAQYDEYGNKKKPTGLAPFIFLGFCLFGLLSDFNKDTSPTLSHGNSQFARARLALAQTKNEIAQIPLENFILLYQKGKFRGNIDEGMGQDAMFIAAEKNRPDIIGALIERGRSVDSKDRIGNSPLHIAMLNNSREAADYLLRANANLRAANQHDQTVLHFAAKHGFYEVARQAIKAGENINADSTGRWQPLHYAASAGHLRLVVLLVENGADTRSSMGYGWTAGDMAFDTHMDIVRFLHSRKGSFNKSHLTKNYKLVNGWPVFDLQQIMHMPANTEVFRAIINDSAEELAKLSQSNLPLDVTNDAKTPALCLAIGHGQLKTAEYLINQTNNLEQTDSNGKTPLIYAVVYGQKKIARLLIKKGAKLSHADETGSTALHYAVSRKDNDIVSELIEAGADLFAVNFFARGALHIAIASDNEIIISTLIENGIDVNAEDITGNTPLHHAAKTGNKGLVNALLKNGADFSVRNHAGQTAIQLANNLEVRQLLSNRFEIEGVNPAQRPLPAEIKIAPKPIKDYGVYEKQ